MKNLQIGDKVTLKNGETHTISAIVNDEVEGNTPYYRWDVDWPYDIVHAAMDDVLAIDYMTDDIQGL